MYTKEYIIDLLEKYTIHVMMYMDNLEESCMSAKDFLEMWDKEAENGK